MGKKLDISGAVKRETFEPKLITTPSGTQAKTTAPPKEDIARITIYFPQWQNIALLELALEMRKQGQKKRDRSALIAGAISDYLEKHGKSDKTTKR
jgi:hypothetical protein